MRHARGDSVAETGRPSEPGQRNSAEQHNHAASALIVETDFRHAVLPSSTGTHRPEQLRISLLGGFQVTVGSRVIDESEWYLRKAKSLVKLLVLAPQHRMHRGQIVDVLWPDLDPEAAANNLHKALHIARRALEPSLPAKTPSSYLRMTGEFVSLEASSGVWIDVDAFRTAAERASTTEDLALYEEAVRLYTGDVLPEDRYEDWAIGQREQAQGLFISLLLDLAERRERRGETEAAIELLRRVVSDDPAHEQAQGSLIRLLAQSGYRQLALRQYQQVRDALRQELDVEPDPSLQALHQQIVTGELGTPSSTHVSAAVLPTPRSNIHSSALIGRDEELERLEQIRDRLFAGHGSLVFVTGDAGMGKSRLVAEVAEDAIRRGAINLWGAAYKRKKPMPYGPIAVALEGFALRLAPELLSEVLGAAAPDLAGLAPAIGLALDHEYAGPLSESPDTRRRINTALSTFLIRLSQDAPVVLVLEDLQAADEASVLFLEHLANLVADVPVLCLCTVRPDEVEASGALDCLLETLVEEQLAHFESLRPLDHEETQAVILHLLGGAVDQPVLQSLQSMAEGNPYYIKEMVHALRGRKRISADNGVWRLRSGITIAWQREHVRRPSSTSGDFRLAPRLRPS